MNNVVANDECWPFTRRLILDESCHPLYYQYVRCTRIPNTSPASFSSYAMLSKTPLADTEGPVWHRFVRFIADDGIEYCGQPESEDVDGEESLCHVLGAYN